MSFTPEQIGFLTATLGRSHVKSRKQAGRDLSYIEGWHAIAEANRIFGFDAWDRETFELRQLGEPREVEGKWRVAYMARVRVSVSLGAGSVYQKANVVREGTGYGSGIDRDLGQAHESAIKEAETDAMKRALMTFGNPFGLALYDKEQNGVEDDAPKHVEDDAPKHEDKKPANTDSESTKAKVWGEDAIRFVNRTGDSTKFKSWHDANLQTIARLGELHPDIHTRLLVAISGREDAFAAVGAA